MGIDPTAMEGFLGWLLTASWKGSLLIGLVVGVQLLVRHRLPPRLNDALWLLVLLRLAAPPVMESDWSLFNLANLRNPALVESRLLPEPAGLASLPVHAPSQVRENTPATHVGWGAAVNDVEVAAVSKDHAGLIPDVSAVAFTVWLGGVLLLLLIGLSSGLRLHLRVRGLAPVTDPALLSRLAACRQQMNVRRPVLLVETNLVEGPAQLGIFRPRVLLPPGLASTLSESQLRFIFCHELAHIKRGDVLISQAAALVQVLHWFNPLVWWAFGRMRADREVSCDARVLSHLERAEHQGYGQTILTLLERLAEPHPVSGAVSILGRTTEIHRRIIMINRFKTGSRLTSLLAVGMVTGLGWVTLTEARAPSTVASQPAAARAVTSEPAALPRSEAASASLTPNYVSLPPVAGVRIAPSRWIAKATPTQSNVRPASPAHGLETVQARLAAPLELELSHATLPQVFEAISKATGVKIEPSAEVIAKSKDKEVNFALEAASAGEALRVLLIRSQLGSCVTPEGIHIEAVPEGREDANMAQIWEGGVYTQW